MPTRPEPLLLDTSAALAFVLRGHPAHDETFARCKGLRLGLAGHAAFETFSTLTRLPEPSRLTAATAATVLERAFPHTVFCTPKRQAALLSSLSGKGISGGAVYDALVAAAAAEHDLLLITRDRRALSTYDRVSVRYEALG